ncbi:MAG: PAS domain-containing sensor histidine kinase, partial [Chloroflexia bacterium]|nr:PAS domain-containing sensor histidine kinase [Chloroflexia bacterium]
VGVAWVGLYVPHHFYPTTVARLEALAHRTVAFLEAAKLADAQGELLDRVQHHHRRLQSVIQAMPEAVMVVRPPNGAIVTSNAAAQRLFGITPSAYPFMMRVTQLNVRTASGDNEPQPIVRALSDGEIVTGVELQVIQRDGSELPVVASAAPLHAEDGTIDAVVGIFQDVRPLKDAQRLRDEFISIVSHELRSPLTPIRGFAQLVARELEFAGGHERHVDWLQTLQRHVDRMTRLIDDLLDVSRLRAGRLETRPAHVDVIEICRSVVASRQATTGDHTVSLESKLDHIDAVLDGDRIYQVVDNLVGNAIKYTSGGTITVAVNLALHQPETLSITVSDQGEGIASSDRESLFNPFYRSREAAASALPGLGLGLFICSELVHAHGGQIDVADAPDGGARFSISLPTGTTATQRLTA